MTRYLYTLGIIAIASALFLVVYVAYLLFYPFPTITISEATVLTKEVKAGGNILYKVTYCKYTDSPATVYRTFHLIDESVSVPTPAVQTISKLGCNVVQIPLATFETMPKGEYYLYVDIEIKKNPIRIIHTTFETDTFEVI